jgi:hypothetical protein
LTQELQLLRGKRILIIEDNRLVEGKTRRELEKLGVDIVGPTRSVGKAIDIVDGEEIDAAILDIDLNGDVVYPLADMLCKRGISFVFATGRPVSLIPRKYRGFVLCDKPTELAMIATALFAPEKLR